MIKLVTIDFWNTLVDGKTDGHLRHQKRVAALSELADQYGVAFTSDDLEEAKKDVIKVFEEVWFGEQRTMNTLEIVSLILEYLGITATESETEDLSHVFAESLLAGPPPILEGVHQALEEMSDYVQMAIISDTMFSPGRVLRSYLESEGLLKYFSSFAFSDEIGHSKPHPNTFKHVLDFCGCDSAEALHIGDMEPTDIKGAKAMGMKAILYTGNNVEYLGKSSADVEEEHWMKMPDIVRSM